MMRIYDLDQLTPEQILNRDIQAEEDVSAAVDAILAEVRRMRAEQSAPMPKPETPLPPPEPPAKAGILGGRNKRRKKK